MEKNLDVLFNPKSVAVIGATANKNKASYTIMKNLMENFKGKIYFVNPKYDEIEGIKTYPTIKDIPDPVDVAIVVVNASIANKVIKESMEKGVKYLIVITAGYREIGKEGIKREQEIINFLKEHNYNTRIVGPNCLGILNTHTKLDVLFLPEVKISKPKKGNISLIFQSGALGSALIDRLASEMIGINKFVSYGNASDLNELDFLEYFINDPTTEVIGVYLEGIRNGRKLYELLKKSQKPVIIIKGGKTDKGGKATLTHTGSLAGNYEIFKGMAEQTNTILAENFMEFENYLKLFSLGKKMRNKEVLVISNGGGFAVLAADEISSSKLSLYELKAKEKKKLTKILPEYANIHNPIDVIGDADSQRYAKVMDIFYKNKKIGAIIVIMLIQTFSLNKDIVDVLSKYANITDKPIIGVIEGGDYANIIRKMLEEKGIVVYRSVYEAVKSLEKLYMWSNKKK